MAQTIKFIVLWVTVYQTTRRHILESLCRVYFEKPIKGTREKRGRVVSLQKFTNVVIMPLNFQWEL
jgi:hypothetical protein